MLITFQVVMVVTFACAMVTLFMGLFKLGAPAPDHGKKSNNLMVLRVVFSVALLLEIILYLTFIRP